MFSFGGSKKSSSASLLAESRNKHLESLSKMNPMARPANAEKTVWRIGLQLADNSVLMIQITLPPTFPTTAPFIQVVPLCQHALLDAQSNVVHSGLRDWDSHSDLGYVVAILVYEFSNRPPVPITSSSTSLYKPMPSPPNNSSSSLTSPSSTLPDYSSSRGSINSFESPPPSYKNYKAPNEPEAKIEKKSETPLPSIPARFPDLHEMSLNELSLLCNDEEALNDYITSIPVVLNFSNMEEEIKAANAQSAKDNLKKNNKINELHDEISVVGSVYISKLKEYEEIAQRLQLSQSKVSEASLIDRVLDHCHTIDNEAEDFGMDFSDGKVDLKEFEKQYIPMKQQYHRATALTKLYQRNKRTG